MKSSKECRFSLFDPFYKQGPSWEGLLDVFFYFWKSLREGFKKKLEFSNRGRGRGSENKKKIPNLTFPKTVPFYLECHDSARNVIKFFWPYVPPLPILLLPYIEPYVHGSLPIYSNCNIHHDLK